MDALAPQTVGGSPVVLLPTVGRLRPAAMARFLATQWVGSIIGEDVRVPLAAIHAGDWLLHMVIMSVIIGLWR